MLFCYRPLARQIQRDPVPQRFHSIRQIAGAGPEDRGAARAEVFVLAGLRRLKPLVRKEAEKMPILDDILDDGYLGPMVKNARAEEGRQIEKRF